MPKKEIVQQRIAEIFDLPRDVIADLPRLTLIGRTQIFVENHKGIILYDKEIIRIAFTGGEIVIKGQGFQIRTVYTHEIYIEGLIENIGLEVSR